MTHHRLLLPALGAVLLATASGASAAERPWIEVASPGFTVVTNASEKAGRQIAWQFEQVRSVVSALWPWMRRESGRPFVVFAVRDEAGLRDLAPKYWEEKTWRPTAVYVPGVARDYVALRTDVADRSDMNVNPYMTAYEGYAYIVLAAAFPGEAPVWFESGLRELIGNTLVRDKDVQVGRLIPWHLQILNEGTRLPLARLLEIRRRDADYTGETARKQFDAQAWALVHFLAFGQKQAHLPKLNRLATLLGAGREPNSAIAESLGDVGALETGFRQYIKQRVFQFAQIPKDVNVKPEGFVVRTLTPAQAAATRAGFHAAMRRPAEARALVAQARLFDPALAESFEVEGLLLDAEDKDPEARAAFARATELGSNSYYAYYRLASLLWPGENDPAAYARLAEAAEGAIRLNPDSADSYNLLAAARTQGAGEADALTPARRAVALEPGDASHRLTLARALWKAGQRPAAVEEAQRAHHLAKDERWKRESLELLKFYGSASR